MQSNLIRLSLHELLQLTVLSWRGETAFNIFVYEMNFTSKRIGSS